MACKRVILDSAESDRSEIIAYLNGTTGSAQAASEFLAGIDKVVDNISEFPTMHAVSRMPQLAQKGYRVALAGSYALLYTYEGETIYIAHIFHQRQDYGHLV